ncbi:MAG: flagellar export protein FliJ [Balneolia bacterium]|nr:flagellar export protein FliJ [Balneolia bacterium]
MKFNFPLDSVLKVRKHEESVQKLKLAKEIQKKTQINELQADVSEKLKQFVQHSNGNSAESIHNIRVHSLYLQQIHSDMESLNVKEHKVEKTIELERKGLQEAYKKRYILEKMKEFKKKDFNEEVLKAEQSSLDEISIQSFSK